MAVPDTYMFAAPDSRSTAPVRPSRAGSPCSVMAGAYTTLSPPTGCLDSSSFPSRTTDSPDVLLPVILTTADVVEPAGRAKLPPPISFRGWLVPAVVTADMVREKFCKPVAPPAPRASSPFLRTLALEPAMAAELLASIKE